MSAAYAIVFFRLTGRMIDSGEALPVWDQIMGMAVLAMLPPVLIVLSMQKLFVKGLIEQEK